MVLVIIGSIIQWLATLYCLVLFARMGFDWARVLAPRWTPSGAVLWIADWVYRLTDPPVRFLRRFIPPLRLGGIALDIGFILLFVGTAVVGRIGRVVALYGYMWF